LLPSYREKAAHRGGGRGIGEEIEKLGRAAGHERLVHLVERAEGDHRAEHHERRAPGGAVPQQRRDQRKGAEVRRLVPARPGWRASAGATAPA